MTAGPACCISSSAPSPSSCTPSALRSTSSRTTSTSRRGGRAAQTCYAVGVILGGLARPAISAGSAAPVRRSGGAWSDRSPRGGPVLRPPGSAGNASGAATAVSSGRCLCIAVPAALARAHGPEPVRPPSPRRTRRRLHGHRGTVGGCGRGRAGPAGGRPCCWSRRCAALLYLALGRVRLAGGRSGRTGDLGRRGGRGLRARGCRETAPVECGVHARPTGSWCGGGPGVGR